MSKHGKSGTRLHHIWKHIKQRCYNTNDPYYKDYGARVIVVCQEWKDDFETFFDWAINNGYRDDLTIDRIDNNKGYSHDNCRWVDRKIQSRNRRNIKQYTINDETHCLSEWCEILNLNHDKIRMRVYRGWPIEQALELEVK